MLRKQSPVLVNPPVANTSTPTLQDIVTVNNDRAWGEELEIEMRNEDGESYTGTVAMQEAKKELLNIKLSDEDWVIDIDDVQEYWNVFESKLIKIID